VPSAAHGGSPISAEFTLDGVGAAFVLITTLVAAAAIMQAALLLPAERTSEEAVTERRFCLFYTLAGLFLCAMYAVLLAQNLGYLWIAMEATTLMSAPLDILPPQSSLVGGYVEVPALVQRGDCPSGCSARSSSLPRSMAQPALVSH